MQKDFELPLVGPMSTTKGANSLLIGAFLSVDFWVSGSGHNAVAVEAPVAAWMVKQGGRKDTPDMSITKMIIQISISPRGVVPPLSKFNDVSDLAQSCPE
ncbi:unnamed protein product [Prorocentrum cordatum]|uniref:Subtilisin n=1 Tax=Prorocentrum cordatum TaxID=2364126 RepID=A0ABN9SN69_9DINO|nr:unnamed protein product [Polarella glacialis]